MPLLISNPGQPDEKAVTVGGEIVTVGRAEDRAICIPDKSLSRHHAQIEPEGGRLFVVDLQSRNGTFVNGVRVRRRELRSGDLLTFGDRVVLFLAEDRPASVGQAVGQVGGQAGGRSGGRAGISTARLRPRAVRPLEHVSLDELVRGDAGRDGRDGSARTERDPGTRPAGISAPARLHILIEVAKLLSAAGEIDTLLGKVLDLVFQILDVDRAALLLVDEATGRLAPRVTRTARGEVTERPIYSQKIIDYVMRKSVAALFADAVCDPRLDAAESVAVQSIRASMCVPLKPKDAIVGVLYVDHLSVAGRFTEDDLDFLVAFASLAAVAVENAALYRRVEQEAGARMQLIMNAKLASLSAMAAGIAHELRNPLNFITNFAEASADIVRELEEDLSAQRAVLDPDVTASFAEALGSLRTNAARITEHGRRADGVIQGLVRHARRPTGVRESGDLNAVVAASVGLTRKWARLGELEVRVDAAYDPAIGPVQMSAADLGQVFINVVDNALYSMRQKKRTRAGPAGGPAGGGAAPGAEGGYAPELRVRTADRGDRAEVRIRDNGLGIPEDAVDRVFDPFFTTKPPGQGTGLGLSLSREIVVEGHRGSMRVETTLGEYAELVITLPKQGGSPSKR